ncbi:hypothetical protein G7Z17_g1161 [Cylindrodendrum hubeiense]|uniref:Ankyrin n=1 Tax=Cylindrodendrum hubeiense TaxID=595255 RepID=A0A9P5HK98_9HYPO|nr:hypothetical protein G7Z17_g1161 [Cylindrodendrum hubeiense]
MKGHNMIVELLLAKEGIDPDVEDKSGRTPLAWAAKKGDGIMVKMLLEKDGVNLNSKDNNDWTPLSWAAATGHKAVVKLLLEKGVNSDSKDVDGRTPLSWAAENGRGTVVRLLLAKDGVDPNLKDDFGCNPLIWAAEHGYYAMKKLARAKRRGPFKRGHGETIDLLLKKYGVLLTHYFDSVAQGPYAWLADLRDRSPREAEMMTNVATLLPDSSSWIPANTSEVPGPEVNINTAPHQPFCAHKCRNTQTGNNKENNDTASRDRFTEYVSREDMQRRVLLFCGLAGVIPLLPAPFNNFGMISIFNGQASIKVSYSNEWDTLQEDTSEWDTSEWDTSESENEDTRDEMEGLAVSLPSEKPPRPRYGPTTRLLVRG